MASRTGKPIIFVVPGQAQPVDADVARGAAAPSLPSGLPRGRLKQSVSVGAERGGGVVRLTAVAGRDVLWR